MTGKRAGVQPVDSSGEKQESRLSSSGGAGGTSTISSMSSHQSTSGESNVGALPAPSDINEVIDSAGTWIREQMETRPYQTVLGAAGVGFLLGRGVVSPFGRMLLLGAGRMALMNAWSSGSLKDGIDRVMHGNA